MPDKAVFRDRVLKERPDLKGRLWLNKTDMYGGYTVSVRGLMTFWIVELEEDLEGAVEDFFIHVDECVEQRDSQCLTDAEHGRTVAPS